MNRILVIDDDKLVRESVALFLENAGYSVVEGATFREGFSNLGGVPASALITDIVSLSEEGYGPFREMRSVSPDFPIIALAGTMSLSSVGRNARPPRIRPTHTLQKPFTVDELLAIIKLVIPAHSDLSSSLS